MKDWTQRIKIALPFSGSLVVELSMAILEVSDHGLAQSAVVARGPKLVPLASLRIIQTRGQTLDVTGRSVSFKLLEVRALA
jgi:hypothetical protein